MIYITKDTINTFVVELSNTLDCDYDYFLFEFVTEMVTDRDKRYFTAPNNSVFLGRYDAFILTDSSAGATATFVDNSAINLVAGQYAYNVYPSKTSINSGNYTALLSTPSVETGRMLVIGENTVIDDVYN